MRMRTSAALRFGRVAFVFALLLAGWVWGGTANAASGAVGAVYVLTNAADRNAVAVY